MMAGKFALPFFGNAAEHAVAASSRRFIVTGSTASASGLPEASSSGTGAAVDGSRVSSGATRVSSGATRVSTPP